MVASNDLAAMKCFVENGFHGSSMAELAKRAGMSVGHICHYYESKDAIIEAIVDRDIEEAPGMLDDFSGGSRALIGARSPTAWRPSPRSSRGWSCEPSTIPIWTAPHSSAPRTSSCANCSRTTRQPYRRTESRKFAGRGYAKPLPESPFIASTSWLNFP